MTKNIINNVSNIANRLSASMRKRAEDILGVTELREQLADYSEQVFRLGRELDSHVGDVENCESVLRDVQDEVREITDNIEIDASSIRGFDREVSQIIDDIMREELEDRIEEVLSNRFDGDELMDILTPIVRKEIRSALSAAMTSACDSLS